MTASVVVMICTARRPAQLRRLLEGLGGITNPSLSGVVVVDNDSGLEGKAVCNAMADTYPHPLISVVESVRGFSSARNRAVAEALKLGPEFLAFLDDDEWPDPAWLEELLRIQRAEDADVIGGPVIPIPAAATPHWDDVAEYYGLITNLPDGAACSLYGAGNFMARRSCFERFAAPFDTAFNEIGGEDLHFFRRLERLGLRVRWSAKAVAFEDTPLERLAPEWLVARQHRRGFVNVLVQQRLDPGPLREAGRFSRSLLILAHAAGQRLVPQDTGSLKALLVTMRWKYAMGRLDAHRWQLKRFKGQGVRLQGKSHST